MMYEYKYNKNYKPGALSETDLPEDLCCRGCGQRCEVSVKLTVRAEFNAGVQSFLVVPEICVGNVRLKRASFQLHSARIYNEGEVSLMYPGATKQYMQALECCHKTCKHSKLR